MKYLTPEIEALSKNTSSKSLVRSSVSCGIFQECNYNEENPHLKIREDILNKSLETKVKQKENKIVNE